MSESRVAPVVRSLIDVGLPESVVVGGGGGGLAREHAAATKAVTVPSKNSLRETNLTSDRLSADRQFGSIGVPGSPLLHPRRNQESRERGQRADRDERRPHPGD